MQAGSRCDSLPGQVTREDSHPRLTVLPLLVLLSGRLQRYVYSRQHLLLLHAPAAPEEGIGKKISMGMILQPLLA
jgi:hypothetical protein